MPRAPRTNNRMKYIFLCKRWPPCSLFRAGGHPFCCLLPVVGEPPRGFFWPNPPNSQVVVETFGVCGAQFGPGWGLVGGHRGGVDGGSGGESGANLGRFGPLRHRFEALSPSFLHIVFSPQKCAHLRSCGVWSDKPTRCRCPSFDKNVGESVDRCIIKSRIRGTNAPVGNAEYTTIAALTNYNTLRHPPEN